MGTWFMTGSSSGFGRLDVTEPAPVRRVVDDAFPSVGHIDVVVNKPSGSDHGEGPVEPDGVTGTSRSVSRTAPSQCVDLVGPEPNTQRRLKRLSSAWEQANGVSRAAFDV